MHAVHSVAALLKDRLNPDGLTLFQANRSAGWQDVAHLHVHLVPRYHGDRLIKPWQGAPSDAGELDDVFAQLTSRH
jgi:histidine triad (HIT) family protein